MTLHDRDIREPLFEWIEGRLDKVRIIEEKTISSSRADALAVLPNKLVGIEIKSDADTYARLARQIKDYDRFFDENVLVVGESHKQAAKHLPDWWGIVTVGAGEDGLLRFETRRLPAPSPLTEQNLKLSILWRPELVHILQENDLPRYKERSKKFVIQRIAALVPEETLARQVSNELFERDYTTISAEIVAYRRNNRSH